MTTTWNPSDKSGVSLTNSNLTMTVTGGFGSGVRGTAGPSSQTGLVYWEYQSLSISSTVNDCLGIAIASAAFTSGNGNGPGSVSISGNGNVNGGSPSLGSIVGHTVCVAVDFDAMLIWFRLDGGNWNNSGTANPATDTGGYDISALTGTIYHFAEGFSAGDSATLALTSGSWLYTAPTGARGWDAANTDACKYSNTGGIGDRRSTITLTMTGETAHGTPTDVLDGSYADTFWWGGGASSVYVNLDFGSAVLIDGFRWLQSGPSSQGTWNWQGSPDNSTWTTLVADLNLGQYKTSSYRYTNTTGYRYYRLSPGTAQSTNSSPYLHQIEFKIGAPALTGTWGSTEAKDTMAFAGGVLGGSWTSTEAKDAMALIGGVLGGAWASVEAKDIFNFNAYTFGPAAATEAKDTMAFTGVVPSVGTWGSTEAKDTTTLAGGLLGGSWHSTEAADTMALSVVGPVATYFDPTTASHGVDFQNLNMTVVNQEGFGEPVGALSNTSYTTGKVYVEFFTQLVNNGSGVGIANSATTFADFGTALGIMPGYATGGAGIFQAQNGTIWINGVEQTNWQGVSLYRANIGVAIDLVNNLIWFRVNGGHWNGIAGANPANGTALPRPPAGGPQAVSGGYDISSLTGGPIKLIAEIVGAYDKVAINAGASAFTYGVPTGFSAWDSVPQAVPALQMDGYATSGVSEVGGAYTPLASGTITLSTTQNDDVIVLGIATGGFWNAALVDHVTSTSGLVWKRRNRRWQVGGYKGDGSTIVNTGLDTEIWWAHAPAALSGEVITVHMDPTIYPGAGFAPTSGTGSMSLVAFGVAGANYTTPWDAHTQAGGFVDNIGNIFYTPATAELSTKADKTFLFGFHGDTLADTGVTQDPWTYVTSATADEHQGYTSFLSLVYQVVEEPQFNTNVVYGRLYTGYPVFQAQSMMFDSIVAADEDGTDKEVVWFWDATSANNVMQLSTGTSLQLSYSATNFNLMVIIEVVIISASGLGEVTSISEGQGSLSTTGFERRSRTVTSTPTGSLAVEIWWGWMPMYTSAERANNDTITINTIHTASGDILGALMLGLGGTTGGFGLGDPFWDVNPSVPATNNSTVSAPPYATDISTTIPSDLLVAWTANNTENVPGFTDPFITLVQAYPATILPNMQLNSLAPPLYTGFEFLYEPGLAANETAEFLAGSPEPNGWIVVADAIPVGPPQPPTGTMHTSDPPDKFTHTGNYTAIGIASPGGWVGAPENHGVIAATEHEDINGGTPDLGYAPFLGGGWLGGVAAFATWHSTEADDQMALYGWVLGFGITGQVNAGENKDRMAFSNRTTVTGTMGAIETKDRWASAGLVLPPGRIHPTTPYKRRLLIIT